MKIKKRFKEAYREQSKTFEQALGVAILVVLIEPLYIVVGSLFNPLDQLTKSHFPSLAPTR